MSLKPTMMFYPVESYNNRQRSEDRWEDDARANLNDDGWQISIKNGKRLRRHWTRNGGLAIVYTSHGERSIYNDQYDVELNRAKNYRSYDQAFQPDGEWGFYTNQH
jgi:hypothetical protein